MNLYQFSTYGQYAAKARAVGLVRAHNARHPADNLVTKSALSIRF